MCPGDGVEDLMSAEVRRGVEEERESLREGSYQGTEVAATKGVDVLHKGKGEVRWCTVGTVRRAFIVNLLGRVLSSESWRDFIIGVIRRSFISTLSEGHSSHTSMEELYSISNVHISIPQDPRYLSLTTSPLSSPKVVKARETKGCEI